jgi:MFS family permease
MTAKDRMLLRIYHQATETGLLERLGTLAGVTPRWATAGVFFVSGVGIGTLLPHVPYLQERLDVSKGVLGLCLLAMSAGALLAMPITGQMLDRRSSRSIMLATLVVFAVALAWPLLAGGPLGLAALLFLVGLGNGSLDVSMNAHGSAIERRTGRPIMSSLHAGWSLGGVVGAVGAALAASADLDPRIYLAGAAAALLALGLVFIRRVGEATVASGASEGFVMPSRGVLLLGGLCMLVMVTEGAMDDWSPLYLRTELGAGADVAAAGFATFAAGMALGRFAGDPLTRRLGAEAVLRVGAALAVAALAGLLLAGSVPVTLAGLALVGLGIANGVPLLFSAAGRTATPGPAIAAVSTLGYGAFLVGPPFIGFLADAIGLAGALTTVCAALATVVALGGRAGQEDRLRARAEAARVPT